MPPKLLPALDLVRRKSHLSEQDAVPPEWLQPSAAADRPTTEANQAENEFSRAFQLLEKELGSGSELAKAVEWLEEITDSYEAAANEILEMYLTEGRILSIAEVEERDATRPAPAASGETAARHTEGTLVEKSKKLDGLGPEAQVAGVPPVDSTSQSRGASTAAPSIGPSDTDQRTGV
jgi:hypothetical protein